MDRSGQQGKIPDQITGHGHIVPIAGLSAPFPDWALSPGKTAGYRKKPGMIFPAFLFSSSLFLFRPIRGNVPYSDRRNSPSRQIAIPVLFSFFPIVSFIEKHVTFPRSSPDKYHFHHLFSSLFPSGNLLCFHFTCRFVMNSSFTAYRRAGIRNRFSICVTIPLAVFAIPL